jgi:hypothetical protein
MLTVVQQRVPMLLRHWSHHVVPSLSLSAAINRSDQYIVKAFECKHRGFDATACGYSVRPSLLPLLLLYAADRWLYAG